VTLHNHVERVKHDGASISESALMLGGLVISTKRKYARWRIWPKSEKRRRLHVWSKFFVPYVVCRRMKCVCTRVADGRITYRVYMVCRRENNLCTRVAGW
jgi:hypothetical protein